LGRFGWSKFIPANLALHNAVMFNYATVKRMLLQSSRWAEQPIEQVLKRIPGTFVTRQRVGGVNGYVVMLRLDDFVKTYIGELREGEEPVF
jgi:hypothetical protein